MDTHTHGRGNKLLCFECTTGHSIDSVLQQRLIGVEDLPVPSCGLFFFPRARSGHKVNARGGLLCAVEARLL